MGRFLIAAALCALLAANAAGAVRAPAQPVFFSLIFRHLTPYSLLDGAATPDEAASWGEGFFL